VVVVGSVELHPLTDGIGQLGDLEELYPAVPLEAWEPYREVYPDLFSGDRWRLPCTCYLVRSGGRTILADTGLGPSFWDEDDVRPEFEGGLLPALAAVGVEPAHVDAVFISHVHGDHIGWNTDAEGEPVFPRARYVLHPEAVARARERSDQPYINRCFKTLFERDLVAPVPPGTELAPGVVVADLPGHEQGHAGLRINRTDAILIADAAAHPALADQPDWVFRYDADADAARETRKRVIAGALDTNTLVVCGHYPGSGIGRLETRNGLVTWVEASA
jgi:glyoxylase-like metal-dependent hydrolase (beta-lactamase superfamily II)